MTRWILVRHAQSEANAERYLSGHLDVPLTLWGWQQARSLTGLLAGERIQRVVSSDLQRASDTAWAAGHGRSWAVRTTPHLRERYLGDWQGMDARTAARERVWDVLRTFDGAPPGGESMRQVARRVTAYLDGLDDGRTTLVVAHGGVLRGLLGLALRHPVPRIGSHPVDNATPFHLDLPRGTWRAVWDREDLEAP